MGVRHHLRLEWHDPVAARLSRIHRRSDPGRRRALHRRRGAVGVLPHRRGNVGIPIFESRARHRRARQADRRRPSDRRGDHDAAIAAKFAAKFSYFNTFGGNPVSAAVGMAVLDVLEREGIQQNVIAAGKVLEPGLARLAAKYPLDCGRARQGTFLGARDRARPRDARAGRRRGRPDHEPAARGRIPARAHGRVRQRHQDPAAAGLYAGQRPDAARGPGSRAGQGMSVWFPRPLPPSLPLPPSSLPPPSPPSPSSSLPPLPPPPPPLPPPLPLLSPNDCLTPAGC